MKVNGIRWALWVLALATSGAAVAQGQALPAPVAAAQAPAQAVLQPPQFRFGADDSFVVRGSDIEEIADKPFRVDSTGSATLPMIGSIHVAGLTVNELQTAIGDRLKKYVRNPVVSVSLTDVQSRPVSVFGAVNASGVQQAGGSKTLVEVLSLAGGLRNDAGHVLTVTRPVDSGTLPLEGAALDHTGQFWIAKVDVRKLLASQRPQDNIRLLANDIVSVPRADVIYVIGDINQAGAIPLFGRLTVTQAVAKAEGTRKGASKQIRILREVEGNAKREEIALDFHKVLNGSAEDQELRPNDIVIIPTNVSRNTALRMAELAFQIGTRGMLWGF